MEGIEIDSPAQGKRLVHYLVVYRHGKWWGHFYALFFVMTFLRLADDWGWLARPYWRRSSLPGMVSSSSRNKPDRAMRLQGSLVVMVSSDNTCMRRSHRFAVINSETAYSSTILAVETGPTGHCRVPVCRDDERWQQLYALFGGDIILPSSGLRQEQHICCLYFLWLADSAQAMTPLREAATLLVQSSENVCLNS